MEALAQTAGVLELSKPENKGKLVFYAGMDKVKFKKQVVPGDQLVMTATFVKRRNDCCWLKQRLKLMESLQPVVLLPLQLGTKEVLHVS